MKETLIAVGLLALVGANSEAHAVGCISGGAAGAVAGHYAGHHAVLGAVGGCIAGHELQNAPGDDESLPHCCSCCPRFLHQGNTLR